MLSAIHARIYIVPQLKNTEKPFLGKLAQHIIPIRIWLQILLQNVRDLNHESIGRLCIRIGREIILMCRNTACKRIRDLMEFLQNGRMERLIYDTVQRLKIPRGSVVQLRAV